jgi:hypothetical protein
VHDGTLERCTALAVEALIVSHAAVERQAMLSPI